MAGATRVNALTESGSSCCRAARKVDEFLFGSRPLANAGCEEKAAVFRNN
jgi:hypothetical protein